MYLKKVCTLAPKYLYRDYFKAPDTLLTKP